MICALRKFYRRHIRAPWLDQLIYAALDAAVNVYARLRRFSFPPNYIRRWKLDMLFELYEPETAALFKRIVLPGMTVIDIGAHIGYFTRLFSRLVGPTGRVYAFEADPENFSFLAKNTRHLRNVERIQCAVSDSTSVLRFYHYDEKSGAHSTLQNVPLSYTKRELVVQATDLDSWLTLKGVSRVEVIKMDIEGGEKAALHGMAETLKKVKVLVTEFAPAWIKAAGSTPLAFLQEIESAGFEICAITQKKCIKISPAHDDNFCTLLPKPTDDSHLSEFVNLYCERT